MWQREMNEAGEGEIKPLQHTCSHLFAAFTDPPPEAKHKEQEERRPASVEGSVVFLDACQERVRTRDQREEAA